MRVLALDIGERRIGVAVSDPEGRVATPVKVVEASSAERDLARIAEDYEPGLMVVGLPLTLAGEEGPQAARVRREAERLSSALGLPVEYADERLTSGQARRAMRAAGTGEREARGKVDMVAAALLLQTYLDGGGGADEPEG